MFLKLGARDPILLLVPDNPPSSDFPLDYSSIEAWRILFMVKLVFLSLELLVFVTAYLRESPFLPKKVPVLFRAAVHVVGSNLLLKGESIEFLEKWLFFVVTLPVIGSNISANGWPGLIE
jgi:hypothetical protein